MRIYPTKVDSARVVAVRLANPCLTLESIGTRFGITRERVRQILAHKGVETRHKRLVDRYECLQCHESFVPKSYLVKRGTPWVYTYCGRACKSVSNLVDLICIQCGGPYQRPITHLKRSNSRFCTKVCFGSYMGPRYGTGTPGNTAFQTSQENAKLRTHCKRGHLRTPENTENHDGFRQCRTCRTMKRQERRAKSTGKQIADFAGGT